MKHNLFKLTLITSLSFFVSACGYNDLPEMKIEASKPFEELLIQYRLKSDIAYMISEKTKNYDDLKPIVKKIQKARSSVLAIQLNLNQYDDRQANRFQSFQNFLSRDVSLLIQKSQLISQLRTDQEFLSLRNQWNRLGQNLVLKKREYLQMATSFNSKKQSFPHSIYNKYVHKLDRLPIVGQLASPQGAR